MLGLHRSTSVLKSQAISTLFTKILTLEQKRTRVNNNIGVLVEIKQIINFMKDILDNCQGLTLANIMIMPHSNEAAAKGEEIYIMKNITEPTRQYLESIVKKHNLAIRYEADKIVIYEPAI